MYNSEFQLIPLHDLSAYELEDIREEFIEYFNDSEEFYDFVDMQIKFYPRGIRRDEFKENVGNFIFYNALNGLRKKLGENIIKKSLDDDGNELYQLGDLSGLSIEELM